MRLSRYINTFGDAWELLFFLFINHVKLNSLSSMTVRNDIEFIMFLAEIGAQERKEHYREQYFGAPDGLAAEIAAEKS